MKREELFTKLHDQYNTFASSIQDPEAFHHDVYEISTTANTCDEFHCLLALRKEQRLRELNQSLESASVEIIANPNLIGTHQWQFALQLFRARSLDALVRYFSSYLPDDHPWHHPQAEDDALSSADPIDDEFTTHKSFFDDDDHDFVREPLRISTSIHSIPASHLPPSPRSLTMCSDSSAAASPIDVAHHEYALGNLAPSRSLSFSGPESDVMVNSGMLSHHDDEEEETSQSDDPDTPTTSISDISDARSVAASYEKRISHHESPDELITPAACGNSVEESIESDILAPRNELESYMSTHRHELTKRSKSLRRPSSPLYTHVLNEYVRSSRKSRRDGSPGWPVRRTSPEVGRVQKQQPDSIRSRQKGQR